MNQNLQTQMEKVLEQKRKKRIWKRILKWLGCLVIFCTTYAMILPAITIEGDTWCEYESHSHGEECYEQYSICEIVDEEHVHEDACYETRLSCQMTEHEHTLSCYSNPEADVETNIIWENTIPSNLTGIWTEDLVSVAESQIGYEESRENYLVSDTGEQKGYTRYGQWYGDPYGDWNGMFVSFCLDYAKVPWKDMIKEAEVSSIAEILRKSDAFTEKESYVPKKGDLIFFDLPEDSGEYNHIGIVASVEDEKVRTIEGDSEDSVMNCMYTLSDSKITGYGILPSNEEVEEEPVTEASEENNPETEEPASEELSTEEAESEEPATEETESEELTTEETESEEPTTEETESKELTTEEAESEEPTTEEEKSEEPTTEETEPEELTTEETEPEELTTEETESEELITEEPEADNTVSKESEQMLMMAPFSMERASTIAEGNYGNYRFSYNETKNAFVNSPEYAKYYNSDSPLGVAGSFHIVAFDTATFKTHTNGNVLAHTLVANSNFGTNNYPNELSYALVYKNINSGSASMNGHELVIGTDNTVTIGGNRDIIYINGTKIDRPYNIVQDADSASAPFIDLTQVHVEIAGISSRLAKMTDKNVSINFKDQNNREIRLTNPNSVGYYHMSAAELNNISGNPLAMQGFTKNGDGTLVINVDCAGADTINMPAALIYIDNQSQSTNEVTEFSNGKVIWNFINAAGVTINTNRMTGMVIALGATVNVKQNLNGTVIAEFVNIEAESHRTDFTGQIELIDEDEDPEYTGMGIRKVDQDNISIYLADAKFELYAWNYTEKKYEPVTPPSGDDYVTDDNGLIQFRQLQYNRAYKLVEVSPPPGYVLGTEVYEFYIPHTDTITYPMHLPDNFNGTSHNKNVIKNIKNSKSDIEELNITIEKEWYIEGARVTSIDGMVEVDVYQKLYKDADRSTPLIIDGQQVTDIYATAVSIDSHGGWEITLNNLPGQGTRRVNGKEEKVYYSYYVVEEAVRGYEAAYENNDGITNGTITVKNTSTTEYRETELSLLKKWYDFEGKEITAPENSSVVIKVYQTAYEDQFFHHAIGNRVQYGDPIELSAVNNWSYRIKNLPELKVTSYENGKESETGEKQTVYYSYTVEEEKVGGYAASYENNGTYNGTIVIKNTQKDHPTVIEVNKKWQDSDGSEFHMTEEIPEIQIDVYQKAYGYIEAESEDGTISGSYNPDDYKGDILYKSGIILSAENGWKTQINNLPLHGWMMIDGENVKVAYTYYIQERQIEGYKTSYENNRGITGTEYDENGNLSFLITITNKKLGEFALPETGGMGKTPVIVAGILLMTGSLIGYGLKNRRKEDME